MIYNIALAGSTGVARRNLEAIGELYFNSQNVATQIVFNLSAMSVFFLKIMACSGFPILEVCFHFPRAIYGVGRLVINFFLEGPDRTIQVNKSFAINVVQRVIATTKPVGNPFHDPGRRLRVPVRAEGSSVRTYIIFERIRNAWIWEIRLFFFGPQQLHNPGFHRGHLPRPRLDGAGGSGAERVRNRRTGLTLFLYKNDTLL